MCSAPRLRAGIRRLVSGCDRGCCSITSPRRVSRRRPTPDRRPRHARRSRDGSPSTQRRLLSSGLAEQERHSLLDQLQLLELERVELDAGADRGSRPEGLPFASLDAIQQALDDREACCGFRIAPWKDLYDDFGGGAWLVAVTRRAATVHRSPRGRPRQTGGRVHRIVARPRHAAPSMLDRRRAAAGQTLLGAAVAGLPPRDRTARDRLGRRPAPAPVRGAAGRRGIGRRSASASRSRSCPRRRCGCAYAAIPIVARRQPGARPRRSGAATRESGR